jgi:hypothetical protein
MHFIFINTNSENVIVAVFQCFNFSVKKLPKGKIWI